MDLYNTSGISPNDVPSLITATMSNFLITRKEATKLLGIGNDTFTRLIDKGLLTQHRWGKRYRYSPAEVVKLREVGYL